MSAGMQRVASLLLNSQELKRQEHRQNAPYIVHDFNFFSAIPTSKTSFKIAPE